MLKSPTKTLLFALLVSFPRTAESHGPYLRHVMMNMMDDDDSSHHDWMGTMHPSSSDHMMNSSTGNSDGIITSCEPPLGPIQDHWWFLPHTSMGMVCQNNSNICCGPLVEIHNCTAPAQAFPGRWNQGFCWGYSAKDCCFTEDGSTNFTFIDCYDSQQKIAGEWEDLRCRHPSLSECCEPPFNVTSASCPLSDYVWPCEGPCCGIQQNWTFCPLETERWPHGWTDDVCFGLLEYCCFDPQNVTDCSDFPYEWPCSGPCCAVEQHFTNCPSNTVPMPGWTDGGCFGRMEHCCNVDSGGNELFTFTSCPDALPKLLEHWVGDTCTAASLSTCCATPQNYTNCAKSASPWPHQWHDGYCLGLFDDCCYEETGSKPYNFTACFESQEKIPGRWNGDVCIAHDLSACCNGTFSTLDGSVYFLSSNSAGSSIGLVVGLSMALLCSIVL